MKRAILLINTGSPRSTKVDDVRKYLVDFLTDPRIISIPKWIRIPLVKGVIVPRRAPKSAEKYRVIWTERGFPLQYHTEELASKLREESGLQVFYAMRYPDGSVERALEQATKEGVDELVVCPLMPHYAMSSYESAVAHVVRAYEKGAYRFQLKGVRPYFDHPAYIEALVSQITSYVQGGRGVHLLFSYHGIPISQAKPYEGVVEKDYEAQCYRMTELIMSSARIRALGLSYEVAFQSRFGNAKWLAPFTSERIEALAKIPREVAVICPSFVCDNLETLWEIDVFERQRFAELGGKQITFIPCPNASDECVRALEEVIDDQRCTDALMWTKP